MQDMKLGGGVHYVHFEDGKQDEVSLFLHLV